MSTLLAGRARSRAGHNARGHLMRPCPSPAKREAEATGLSKNLVGPYRGHLKVCALKHANSDKPRTQNSNGLIAFAELGFEMFGHGQSGLLLGGEAA